MLCLSGAIHLSSLPGWLWLFTVSPWWTGCRGFNFSFWVIKFLNGWEIPLEWALKHKPDGSVAALTPQFQGNVTLHQYLLFFQCQVSFSLPPLQHELQDCGQWNECRQESSRSLSVELYGEEKESLWSRGHKPVPLLHGLRVSLNMSRAVGDGGEQ